MVAKHRRSDSEPSLMSPGAPVETADIWPEAVGYGRAGGTAWPMGGSSGPGRAAAGYPGPSAYGGNDYGGNDYGGDGYGGDDFGGAAVQPAWLGAPDDVWQEWHDWRNWGPPPAMHPDHPSAPVPRVQLPADQPPESTAPVRAPGPGGLPQRRRDGSARGRGNPAQRPDAGDDSRGRRLHAVPDGGSADNEAAPLPTPGPWDRRPPMQQPAGLAGPAWPGTGFQRQQGLPFRDAGGSNRLAPPGWQETTGDSLRSARQLLTLADGQAARIAQEAQDYAASMRAAAEREATAITQRAASEAEAAARQASGQAAAIREAAEQEAAEVRARLDLLLSELSRVTAYVTESLAAPGMPGTAPALPALPALPAEPIGARLATAPAGAGTMQALPASAAPARPDTRPSRTGSSPARPDAKPARPAGPRPSPAKGPQKQPRQHQAMRIASYATASLLLFSAITGATEFGLHGFKFFVFRAGGIGQTPGNENDEQFLARQAAVAHHVAPSKGRHAKDSHQTIVVHKK